MTGTTFEPDVAARHRQARLNGIVARWVVEVGSVSDLARLRADAFPTSVVASPEIHVEHGNAVGVPLSGGAFRAVGGCAPLSPPPGGLPDA